jgi:5-methylcytosine-specific restriction endonuclease McrA
MKKQVPTNGRNSKRGYRGVQIRKDLRLAIYLRDEFHCVYCGKNLHRAKQEDVTLDHLTPDSKGGSNEPKNLVTACRRCNCSRQDKPWRQYATGGAVQHIQKVVRRQIRGYRDLAKAILEGKIKDPRHSK